MSKESEIYMLLEKELYSNQFVEGERFYSENQLVSKFKISRLTARNILKRLEKSFFISAKKAIGYFVIAREFWNKGASWNKNKQGIRTNEIKPIDKILDSFFIKKFNVNAKNYKSYLKIRKLNGIISRYSLIWIHKQLVGNLNEKIVGESTLKQLKSKNSFDCSFNVIKTVDIIDLDLKIFGKLKENTLPVKYSVIQNEDMEFIQFSVEKYKPEFFEHYFIQNL